MTEPLEGKSILIVGATGGLGTPIAQALAGHGALLTLQGRDEGRLKALSDLGPTVALDIRRADAARRLVDVAVAERGFLDGVVYAAGVVAFGGIADTPDEVLIEAFTVNALGPMRLMRAAVQPLRQSAQAGRDPFFLTVSAVVAEQPMAGMAAYSASKAALTAYDAAAAREWRREGIRVIDARPPHTETGLATRPIHGQAPRLPQGLTPQQVADRIVAALEGTDKDLPSSAFAALQGL